MEAFLLGIEELAPVRALKSSFYAYPVVNALHILSVGALVTSVVLLDLRMLGRLAAMPAAPLVALMRRVALAAFAGAALSGLALFAVRARDYASTPLFVVKMGLILLAAVNFVVFVRLARGAMPVSGLAQALAATSIAFWLAVVLTGRFLGFV